MNHLGSRKNNVRALMMLLLSYAAFYLPSGQQVSFLLCLVERVESFPDSWLSDCVFCDPLYSKTQGLFKSAHQPICLSLLKPIFGDCVADNRHFFFMVSEAVVQIIRCQQIPCLLRAYFLVCRLLSSHRAHPHMAEGA